MVRAVLIEQRTVDLPADAAVERLPAVVSMPSGNLRIDRTTPSNGTSVVGALRYPAVCRSGGRTEHGHVEIGPLSGRMALVEAALPRSAGPAADALSTALEGRPAPAPAVPASAGPRWRLVAAGATLALVAAAVPLVGSLTRVQPVSVDLATARYREAAGVATPLTEPATAPSTAESGNGSQPVPVADGADHPIPPGTADDPAPVESSTTPESATGADVPDHPGPTSIAADAAPEAPPQPAAPTPDPANPESELVRPEPGVYRYATTGWEELSMPGSRRQFPEESAQTVTHTACGYQVGWQPLEERADTFELCVDGDQAVLAGASTYRSFFGRAVEQHFTCVPAATPAGATWTVHCDEEEGATTMQVTSRGLGEETLDVAGQPMETLKVRLDSVLDGESSGTRTAVMWHTADGLLVRTEVRADLDVHGPFGQVRYTEEHTRHLSDLHAHR